MKMKRDIYIEKSILKAKSIIDDILVGIYKKDIALQDIRIKLNYLNNILNDIDTNFNTMAVSFALLMFGDIDED